MEFSFLPRVEFITTNTTAAECRVAGGAFFALSFFSSSWAWAARQAPQTAHRGTTSQGNCEKCGSFQILNSRDDTRHEATHITLLLAPLRHARVVHGRLHRVLKARHDRAEGEADAVAD